MKLKLFMAVMLLIPFLLRAQLGEDKTKFTKADTLRGSLNENRTWWDVLRYDIEVKPDYESKTIQGKVRIAYKIADNIIKEERREIIGGKSKRLMQLDLQKPLIVDSIVSLWSDGTYVGWTNFHSKSEFQQIGNIVLLNLETVGRGDTIAIYYHGTPIEAKRAPWDGGWVWTKDSLGRPWMSVAVQGLGASAWYPCKDHQSDEPDNGASLTIIVPDTLVGVGNGRLVSKTKIANTNLIAYKWEVKNPINNYNIIPSIGKYLNWTDTFVGAKQILKVDRHDPDMLDTVEFQQKLNLSYWVLDYNLAKSKIQYQQAKSMLRCFEYWFGPYPFYEDGYKLVDAPFLGMEHQSAVAYGNGYKNGYRGRDLSGTGWGLKWDFIIVHESGHEWFANNITSKDLADMWIHEGFTDYSETLYTEWMFGKQAADEYNYGIRKNIRNDSPIIGPYGVNKEGSGDMYYKSGNMLHTIRKVINDDEKFRQILTGLNKTFWHQTVTTQQVEGYINKQSGINFQKTFDQYLRTIQIPQLEFYFGKDKKAINYRWTNCIAGFDLPLVINNKRINITTDWKSSKLTAADTSNWDSSSIEKQFYITVKQVK
jgi:aminopeptidase N